MHNRKIVTRKPLGNISVSFVKYLGTRGWSAVVLGMAKKIPRVTGGCAEKSGSAAVSRRRTLHERLGNRGTKVNQREKRYFHV